MTTRRKLVRASKEGAPGGTKVAGETILLASPSGGGQMVGRFEGNRGLSDVAGNG
jgi:hypothetical protein